MFRCLSFRCGRPVDFVDKRHCNLLAVPDDVLRHRDTLEDLLLDANQIRELPRGLYRLVELRKLTFSDNEISRIASDIGNLINLEELDASSNDIEEIPENVKFCKNLQTVNFSSNPISKLPEGFTQLRNLIKLSLNDVCLNRLPSDFGSLCKLESLELRENLIKYLPSSLSLLSKLRIFDLGSNLIEELPSSIGSLPSLEELWLDSNKISTLPVEMGKLKLLAQLDLSDNKLEELPDEIGDLANLTDLLLSRNQLRQLPEAIGNLGNLTILKVDQNLLQTLTDEIGKCFSLQELILTENSLTVLPATIGKLSALTNLNIDKNHLTQIPKEIGECSQLGVLSVRDNQLTSIPDEIGSLRLLHVLDVSGNRLHHLPMAIGSCNLKAIWMSENQSKPMLNFQEEINEENGKTVLTCFLLPQQSCRTRDDTEGLVRDDDACDDDLNDHGRASFVGFSNMNDVDADGEEGESHFVRQNTPHPKELRTRHSKQFRKDGDGRIVPHDQQNPKDSGAFFPARDPGMLKNICSTVETSKQPFQKRPPIVKIHPPSILSGDDRLASASTAFDARRKMTVMSGDDPETSESPESPLLSDEGNDDVDDDGDDEEVVVHRVGFVDAVDNVPEREGKLRRRDTPHHLKNKRINPDLAKADSEEKVRQILAQVAGFRSSSADVLAESLLVGQNSPMEETDYSSREGEVESGVCDDVLSASDDEAADEMTKLLPASSTATESEVKPSCHIAPRVASNRVPDNVEARQEVASNLAEAVVRVVRKSGTGLGISIAGGIGSMPYKAGDKGIFISRVTDDGPSSRAGLHAGDKLISVNGRNLIGAEHRHAVAVLKEAGNEVVMVIGREIDQNEKICDWSLIENDINHVNAETVVTTLHRNQSGFGFSIAGGRGSVPYRGGVTSIYISRIAEGGTADRDGKLQVGDWIVSINGQNVTNSRHDEVVKMLTTGNTDITLVVYREIPETLNGLQPQSEETSLSSGSAPTKIPFRLLKESGTAAKGINGTKDSNLSSDRAALDSASASGLTFDCSNGEAVVSRMPKCIEPSAVNTMKLSSTDILCARISSAENAVSPQNASDIDNPILSKCKGSLSTVGWSEAKECTVSETAISPLKVSNLKTSPYSVPDAFSSGTKEMPKISHGDTAVSDSRTWSSSVSPASPSSLSLAHAPASVTDTAPSPTLIHKLPFSANSLSTTKCNSPKKSSEISSLVTCDSPKKSSEISLINANGSDLPGAVIELFDALERNSFSSVGSCTWNNETKTHPVGTRGVLDHVVAAQNAKNLAEGDPKTGDCSYPTETVVIVKAGGPLGLSIVGGSDHPSHPFGTGDPGIFISKIVSDGAAAKTSLKIGDRILSVNGKDIRGASHTEAGNSLTTQAFEILLEVRHDPQPPGLQEIKLYKEQGERLGITIRGGTKSKGGNPVDKTDEGIFIAQIEPNGTIARDGRLKVGQRILEVNRQSLLGVTHQEAVEALLGVTDKLVMLVCDGFDAALLHRPASSETADGEEHSQLKPRHDGDLGKRQIVAFESKRKSFEKEIESALPSNTELSRNDETLALEKNLSIQQSEFKLQSTISDNSAINIAS